MWLSGWNYRKKITITGQSGAGTNYQVLLKIGESSGASGADFHIENHSLDFPSDKNDSGDLRFTTDDGETLLSFWVEGISGTTPNRVAYAWVKVSADLDSNKDIYCYYGKSGASNVSNGVNTFLFFDDFDSSTLDAKWTIITDPEGSISLTDRPGFLRFKADSSVKYIGFSLVNTNNISSVAKLDCDPSGLYDKGHIDIRGSSDVRAMCRSNRLGGQGFSVENGAEYAFINDSNTTDLFLSYNKINNDFNFLYKIGLLNNFNNLYSETVDLGTINSSMVLSSKSLVDFDYYYQRKFVSTEPSFSSATSETVQTQKTIKSNAKIKQYNVQKTITSNAYIVKPSVQKTITSNAKIKQYNVQKTIKSNAYIIHNSVQQTIKSNAKIKQYKVPATIKSNAYIVGIINSILSTNLTLLQTIQKTLSTVLVISQRIFTKISTNFTLKSTIDTKLSSDLRLITSTIFSDYQEIAKSTDIITYLDGVELTDIEYGSLKITYNINSTPSEATFTLGRRHDKLDYKLDGTYSEITDENKIQIYDGTRLLFTGYIGDIKANLGTDTVSITAKDKRALMKKEYVHFYYGAWTAEQITYQLISTGICYSIQEAINQIDATVQLPCNFVPEPGEINTDKVSALDTLIRNTANIDWYVDENENIKIRKIGGGTIKTLSLNSLNSRINKLNIISEDIELNYQKDSYTKSIKVDLGEDYTTVYRNSIYYKQYKVFYNSSNQTYSVNQAEVDEDINNLKRLCGVLNGELFVIQNNKYVGNNVSTDSQFVYLGKITVMFIYQWIVSDTRNTYVVYNHLRYPVPPSSTVIIGSGDPQKYINMQQYGSRVCTPYYRVININGTDWLAKGNEMTYDYKDYGKDIANFELTQNNSLITSASITLLLDAFEYYNLGFDNRINIDNTIETNIYNNSNGFPLNIDSVVIDCSTRVVTLNLTNYGKTYYQKSVSYNDNFQPEYWVGLYRSV